MTHHRAAASTCLLAALTFAATATAAAQDASAATRRDSRPAADTAGWLPTDHWTRDAIARIAASAHGDAALATLAWPASRATIRQLLDRAATPDPTEPADPRIATAQAWLDRFDAEFAGRTVIGPVIALPATLGIRSGAGSLLAGHTLPSPSGFDYTGPVPANEKTGVFVEMGLAARIAPRFAVSADWEIDPGDSLTLLRATASARFDPVELWIGRREIGFGPRNGGIVMAGGVPFDGGGFDTPDGFRLPGFLSGLGPLRINQLISRFDRSGDIAHPWFVATRLSFSPSDRVTFGINRAALFGGEGNEPVTLGRILLVVFGITDSRTKDSDFENQVASLDVAWNVGRSVLVTAEYGFDDAGTSFILVPGLTLGVLWASPAWAPALSIGGSVTGIASSCCGHPAWYLHGALSDGWTDRGVLLGHPLGGNGLEAGLDLALDPASAPILARGRVFVRQRGSENLFSPDREGVTGGVEAWLEAFFGSFRLEAGLESEVGVGRDRWRAELRAAF